MKDTINRFNKSVESYDAYRPTYPRELMETLTKNFGITKNSIIADIGSGTGKLTELFLNNGNEVFAVEPNDGMRRIAEEKFNDHSKFHSIIGTAEATGLADKQIDLITAGQSFHWFKEKETRIEFRRILKEHGLVMLIWNFRKHAASDFMQAYENLILEFGIDYNVGADQFDLQRVARFFEDRKVNHYAFQYIQELDWHGCLGRLESTSYVPKQGGEGYDEMIKKLTKIFDRFNQNGKIAFIYQTDMFVCGL